MNNLRAADDWLGEADELARRVPDDPARNWQHFSATNVGIWKIDIGVERGLRTKVLSHQRHALLNHGRRPVVSG